MRLHRQDDCLCPPYQRVLLRCRRHPSAAMRLSKRRRPPRQGRPRPSRTGLAVYSPIFEDPTAIMEPNGGGRQCCRTGARRSTRDGQGGVERCGRSNAISISPLFMCRHSPMAGGDCAPAGAGGERPQLSRCACSRRAAARVFLNRLSPVSLLSRGPAKISNRLDRQHTRKERKLLPRDAWRASRDPVTRRLNTWPAIQTLPRSTCSTAMRMGHAAPARRREFARLKLKRVADRLVDKDWLEIISRSATYDGILLRSPQPIFG